MSEEGDKARERLRELCERVKQAMDYRVFYACYNLRFDGARAMCPIVAHHHSGRGAASLSVDTKRGLFHCFSRDEGGDAIRFYELMHNVSFARAVRELAREYAVENKKNERQELRGRTLPDKRNNDDDEYLTIEKRGRICEAFLRAVGSENQDEGLRYLERRGIKPEVCERLGIRYFPRESYEQVMTRMLDEFAIEDLQASGLFNSKRHLTFYTHRLLFPLYVERQAIYLQARTINARVKSRWHNMRGGVPALYNADVLSELVSGETIFLVEGFTDTLTLVSHGFHAVGLVGAAGMREEWLPPLARFKVVCALDPDEAGKRASENYKQMFARRGISLGVIDLPCDVNDYFRTHTREDFERFVLLAVERSLRELD